MIAAAPNRNGPVSPFETDNGSGTVIYTVDLGNGHLADIEGPAGATPEQLQQVLASNPQLATGAPQGAEMQGGFAYELPDQPASKLPPEIQQQFISMLQGGASKDQLLQFLHDHGGFVPTNLDDVIAYRDRTGQVVPDVTYSLRSQDTSTGGAVGRGLEQGASLGFSDELGGALAAGQAILRGESPGEAYNRSVDESRALLSADSEQHPYASLAGQLAGGLALPLGLERAGLVSSARAAGLAAREAALAEGLSAQQAENIGARAVIRRLSAEGAAYGGAYGTGTAQGGPGERFLGGGIGAVEGGVGGALIGGVGRAANRLFTGAPAELTDGQQVAQAAERQGITPFAADVGGPTTRRLTSAMVQTPMGAGPIVRAAQQVNSDAQAVRDRIATSIGTVLNPEAAGETAIAGAKSYIARTSAKGNALYRAAESAAQGARIVPTHAIEVLDQNIAELSETPGGATALARLQGLRDALAKGDFTVSGIRNMRTALRDEFVGEGLRGSDLERRVNQVVDAANDDVVEGLKAQGKGDAAEAYRRADQYWRDRLSTIDNNLAPIIGRNGEFSGEKVVANLQSAMRGNNRRFIAFLDALPENEQADVRASLIGRLGRATKGAQNEEGSAFSLQTFLSNWDDIGESAKRRLFGPEGRAALNDLATVARGSREAARYANRSNTGGVDAALITGLTATPTAGASIIAPWALSRLLASPRFARWLARSPKGPLPLGYINRLSRIAKAEPAIAGQALQLQRYLTDAMASAPATLAAQPTADGIRDADRGNAVSAGQQNQQELRP